MNKLKTFNFENGNKHFSLETMELQWVVPTSGFNRWPLKIHGLQYKDKIKNLDKGLVEK